MDCRVQRFIISCASCHTEHKVLVYNFADFKLLHQIETLANPKGLVAISSSAESTVLACLGLHTGQVG